MKSFQNCTDGVVGPLESRKTLWSAKTVLRLTDESKIESMDDHACPHCLNRSKRLCKEFLRQCPVCRCAPPGSGFQPNVHCADASLATHDLDRKLGLLSGDFMKNTEMSPATKSNCELQPESERRLHQFQDSLLPSA